MNNRPQPATPEDARGGQAARWRGLARGWVAARWWLLAAAVLLAAAAWPLAGQLRLERSLESMFPPGDPVLQPFVRLKQLFAGNQAVLAVYEDSELFSAEGMRRLRTLSQALEQVPGVEGVMGLTTTPLGESIRLDNPLSRSLRELFTGYLLGRDQRTTAVVCLLRGDLSPEQQTRTLDQLEQVVRRHVQRGMLVGEPVMVHRGFRLVENEGRRLGRWVTALVLLVCAVSFGRVRWVVVPLVVVGWSVLLTQAGLVLLGLRLSMVSSMLVATLSATGMAAVVHVAVHFEGMRQGGASRTEALRACALVLAWPVAWTCLTDAAGFGSLGIAPVEAIRDYGTMMAIGSLWLLTGMGLLLPGLGSVVPDLLSPGRARPRLLQRGLARVLQVVRRRPRSVAAALVLLAGVLGAGNAWVEVETNFIRNFRADSPLVQAYQEVETRLGGAGVWDVVVPAPKEPNPAFLRRLERLCRRLREEAGQVSTAVGTQPGLTKVLSVADLLNATPGASLPFLSPERTTALKWKLLQGQMPLVARVFWATDPREPHRHFTRVMLRSHEQQPAHVKKKLIATVRRICREEFPPGPHRPGAWVTGYYVLLAHLIDSLVEQQWRTLLLALVVVALMMRVALGSWSLAAVSLVPNVLPVLAATGTLGYLDLVPGVEAKLNMGAVMIAAVSLGLGIDASIHYLTAYRRLRTQGLSPSQALEQVQSQVGTAAVLATVAMMVGFSVLATSEFVPLVYFGLLTALALAGGLLGNLVLLPALLIVLPAQQDTEKRHFDSPLGSEYNG